jgi:hypothetical protein
MHLTGIPRITYGKRDLIPKFDKNLPTAYTLYHIFDARQRPNLPRGRDGKPRILQRPPGCRETSHSPGYLKKGARLFKF